MAYSYDPADDFNADGRVTVEELQQIVDEMRPDSGLPWWWLPLSPILGGIKQNAEQSDFKARVRALEQKYGIQLMPYAEADEGARADTSYETQADGADGSSEPLPESSDPAAVPTEESPFGDATAAAEAVASGTPFLGTGGTRKFGPGRPLGVDDTMIQAGVVRQTIADDGSVMYESIASDKPMRYAPGNAKALLELFEADQLAAFRQAAWVTGYNVGSRFTSAVNEGDVSAMEEIMADANIAGLSWNELLNRNAARGMRETFSEFGDYRFNAGKGDAAQQLQRYARDNGVVLSDGLVDDLATAVSLGRLDEKDAFGFIKENYVKRLYPGWERDIDLGLSIKDIAAPMIQYAAQRLGVDPGLIDVFDPAVQQFLTEQDQEGGITGAGLNRMNDIIEQHPYWAYSPDAEQKLGVLKSQIMSEFGFETDPSFRPLSGYGSYGALDASGVPAQFAPWASEIKNPNRSQTEA